MKQTYVPTEADRLTGQKLRELRRLHGETMQQAIDASGVKMKQSTYSRVELGQRALSLPDATKLAAHFDTTVDKIFGMTVEQYKESQAWKWRGLPQPPAVETEQQFLGNEKPALFAVPDQQQQQAAELDRAFPKVAPKRSRVIDLDAPLSPADYHAQVWVPYLEARYAADKTA